MSWQVIELKNALPSPWRNGGGVTRELFAWPDSQDWLWRMSVAEVESSGPFSHFDGVQRWFAVLAGAGVRLCVAGQTHELTSRSAPLCFDGAIPVNCQLLDGATQDFNLMLRSDKASAQMERVSGQRSLDTDTPIMVAVYASSTGASVYIGQELLTLAAHSLAWRLLPPNTAARIESADALWMEIDA